MALFKIAQNVVEGKEPAIDLLNKIKELGGELINDGETVLETFAEQFASDFGTQALSQAETLAPTVIDGTQTIQQAATTLLGQVTADAVTDAEKDGTVALNALRVQITAQTTSSQVAADPKPSVDPAAQQADAGAASAGSSAPLGSSNS